MSDKKNPFAIAVGQRLKQARLMAGFGNVEQMLQTIPGWEDKRSRVTNYEAGISLASPEAILSIAKATGCSPCWLMFESGPIRASGRDNQAIRHQNLVAIVEEVKAQRKVTPFLKSLGISKQKLNEYLENPFIEITDRIARRCEQFVEKGPGWLDEQHVENDPICQSFPDDLRELMTIYSELESGDKRRLLEIARIFAKQ